MSIAARVRGHWDHIRHPGWVRPRPTRRQQRIDVLLAGCLFLFGLTATLLLNSIGLTPGSGIISWHQIGWLAGLIVPLFWRRRFPNVVLVLVSGFFLAGQMLLVIDNYTAVTALFWAMYTVGAWSRHRMLSLWLRLSIILAMLVILFVSVQQYAASAPPELGVGEGLFPPELAALLLTLMVNLLYFLSAVAFGTTAWISDRQKHELRDQAAALSAAQETRAQQAVMRERLHIARELHDVVAHHVSVMGVQASAARRVLGKNPDLAVDALTAVEATARVAIADLRGLLGVLRDVGQADRTQFPGSEPFGVATDTLSAAPGVDQVGELIRKTESAGLAIRYGVFGDPKPLPAGMSLCVFRVVQEALTNVIKHARATDVDVRLRYLDSSIEVEVTDNGTGAPRTSGGDHGYGLAGMRERVAVHAGELVVGPRHGGGFRVRATLPLPAHHGSGQARPGAVDPWAAADREFSAEAPTGIAPGGAVPAGAAPAVSVTDGEYG